MILIEYDYEITRNEETETKIYTPKLIPTTLDNLVSIEAPNSAGKSTLLNIIALSLYGHKNDKIPESLKRKINNLYNAEHQTLKYRIKITNSDNSLEILSEKKDHGKSDIIVHETFAGGKPCILSSDELIKKYNLIYDIPENPTDRLKQLAYEIKDTQNGYGNRVGELTQRIKDIIIEIRKSRNPDSLKRLAEQHTGLLNEAKNLHAELDLAKKEFETIELATYYEYYSQYIGKCDELELHINNLKKELRKTARTEVRENKKSAIATKDLKAHITSMQTKFFDLSRLLKILVPRNESNRIKIWEKINLNQTLEDLEFDANLEREIIHFKRILNELHSTTSNNESFKEIKLYKDLISVFENNRITASSVPGLEKNIPEFVNDLKKIVKAGEVSIIQDKNYTTALRLLGELREEQKDIMRHDLFKIIQESRSKQTIDTNDGRYERIESDIKESEIQLKKLANKAKKYETELYKKGDFDPDTICHIGEGDLSKYSTYTEDQLLQKISSLENEIVTITAKSSRNETQIERCSKELDELEKKEPHEYQDHLNKLDELEGISLKLNSKLMSRYGEYIKHIIGGKIHSYNNMSKEQSKYYESIFSYMGTVLGTINHLDKIYNVLKVDLISEKIITSDGTTIMFADMGTGQSQSAYIMSLLNNADDRKIIALFDEIAMMDRNSLKPIYKKMMDLYNENKLLVGIVVQKSDADVKITPL